MKPGNSPKILEDLPHPVEEAIFRVCREGR
jgi:hypothetical protein